MEKLGTSSVETCKENDKDKKMDKATSTESIEDICINKEECIKQCPRLNERKCCIMYSSSCNLFYIFLFVFIYFIFKYFVNTFQEFRNLLYSIRNMLNNIQHKLEHLIYNTNTLNTTINNSTNSVVKEIDKTIDKTIDKNSDKIPEKNKEKLEGKDDLNIKNIIRLIEHLESSFK
jgi:hypothetical protein